MSDVQNFCLVLKSFYMINSDVQDFCLRSEKKNFYLHWGQINCFEFFEHFSFQLMMHFSWKICLQFFNSTGRFYELNTNKQIEQIVSISL